MIFLHIFLGILWFIVISIYSILCGIHIRQQFFRAIIVVLLGLSVLLCYFAFSEIIFFILTILELIPYIIWEHYEVYLKSDKFKPSKFIKRFYSWIFVKNEDVLINLVFPKFLTYFVVLIISTNRKFRSLLPGITNAISLGVDVDVENNDGIVSIHI
ncbi:MAG: hypothetical protein PHX21_06825 [bacterium]|nr:hypothetical protein [bacterium]